MKMIFMKSKTLKRTIRFFYFFRSALLFEAAARPYTHLFWIFFSSFIYGLTLIDPMSGLAAISLLLFLSLLYISVFDIHYFLIPQRTLIIMLLGGIGAHYFTNPNNLLQNIAAGILIYILIILFANFYHYLRGADGLGEGDAKLLAISALWVGVSGLASVIVYGVISALISAGILLMQGKINTMQQKLPFGPHLALGIWLVWIVGPVVFN